MRWALTQVEPGETLFLHYFGGEPLLDFDTLPGIHAQALALANERGAHLEAAIVTNGTLLTREFGLWAQEQGIEVTISLDGTRAVHDANRRFPDGTGSYEGIREALARSGLDPGIVTLATVLSPDTIGALPQSIDALIDEGFRRFSFSPDYLASWDEPSRDRARTAIRQLGELCLRSLEAEIPVHFSFIEEKIRRLLPGNTHQATICRFGRGEMAIDPDGNIFPCERIIGAGDEFLMGRLDELLGEGNGALSETSLQAAIGGCNGARGTSCSGDPAVFPHARVASWEQTPFGMTDCSTCADAPVCTNSCRCINHLRTGSIFEPDELVCFFERLFIGTSRRVAAAYLAPNPSSGRSLNQETSIE